MSKILLHTITDLRSCLNALEIINKDDNIAYLLVPVEVFKRIDDDLKVVDRVDCTGHDDYLGTIFIRGVKIIKHMRNKYAIARRDQLGGIKIR